MAMAEDGPFVNSRRRASRRLNGDEIFSGSNLRFGVGVIWGSISGCITFVGNGIRYGLQADSTFKFKVYRLGSHVVSLTYNSNDWPGNKSLTIKIRNRWRYLR